MLNNSSSTIHPILSRLIATHSETRRKPHHFNHLCCVFTSDGNVTRIGQNDINEAYNGCMYGVHAEMNALFKLPPLNRQKTRIRLNIVVVRIDGQGRLKDSKPCAKCIKHMNRLPFATCYRIDRVYYSSKDGSIVKSNLSTLNDDNNKYITSGFRHARARNA